MTTTIALIALVLLLIGLYNRRKEKQAWLKGERYEESGEWIDKRSGERGTFGSLDAEREAERFAITRQGRLSDLAIAIRDYGFAHFPAFQQQSDEAIKAFVETTRKNAAQLFQTVEKLQQGPLKGYETPTEGDDAHQKAIGKLALAALHEQFGWLAELDLDLILQADRAAAQFAAETLRNMA